MTGRPAGRRGHACGCSRSSASTNADLARSSPNGTTYQVEWVEIDQPDVRLSGHQSAACRRHDQRPGDPVRRRAGPEPKGRRYSPGSRAPSTTTAWIFFTSTQGGGAAEPSGVRHPSPAASGNGNGQIWGLRHAGASGCTCSTSRPEPTCSTSRTTSRPARAGTWCSARTGRNDNFIRGADPAGRPVDHRARTTCRHSQSPTCAVRGPTATTSSPGRLSARTGARCSSTSRSSIGMSFAIWGPWGRHRRLSRARTDEAACRG